MSDDQSPAHPQPPSPTAPAASGRPADGRSRRTLGLIIGGLVVAMSASATVGFLIGRTTSGTSSAAAASASDQTSSGAATSSRTSASAAVATSNRPTPTSTSPAAPAINQPGAAVDNGAGRTVTYYSMQRPAAPNAPAPESPGTEWVAIDVQACYGPGSLNWDNSHSWVLVDQNNGQYDPSSTGYSQFPSPEFPGGDLTVTAGQCIRGWIVYPVVVGEAVVAVAYMPYEAKEPIVWTP